MALRFWRAEETVTARGNLSDVHVAELIHLISQARKTGALAMSSGEQESVLYFRKGALVDVRAGQESGLEALSQIVGWSEGTFEFRSNALTDDVTIEMDMHAALAAAARIHNEKKRRMQEEAWRKLQEEQQFAAETEETSQETPAAEALLVQETPAQTAEQQFSAAAWREQEAEAQPAEKAEAEPVEVAEAQPVIEAEAEPVEKAEAQPAQEVEAEPVEKAEAQPVIEAETQPVEEAVAEAEPVIEAEAQPVEVAVAEAEPVVEAVAQPMQEVEAEPVIEAEAQPVEAAEAQPEQSAQPDVQAEEPTQEPLSAEVCEQIGQWIAKAPFLRHVSLLDAGGRVIGEAHAFGASPNGTSKLSQHMREFVRDYPRAEMRRVVIEDEAGTVVLANLPQERLLIAVADGSVSLGNVCVTLSKMTVSLGA